jgi:hypothetical protein
MNLSMGNCTPANVSNKGATGIPHRGPRPGARFMVGNMWKIKGEARAHCPIPRNLEKNIRKIWKLNGVKYICAVNRHRRLRRIGGFPRLASAKIK